MDPFEGLVLDDTFVKGGIHEPPARTRDAIARLGGRQTSWRFPVAPGSRPIQRARRRQTARLRGLGRVFGVSWVFATLAAVFAGSAYASWHFTSSRPAVFAFVLSGWLVSLCFHEFAHAAVAYWGGDRSTAVKGYLSLDLRRYAHPAFSFLLPVLLLLWGGIGLPGGAVWIDHSALRSRRWRSLTSLAGPAANAACAAACIVPFAVVHEWRTNATHLSFWSALAFLGLLQLWAVALNLLPIPGLDGWGVLEPYLPARVAEAGRRFSPFGIMILFFLVMSSPTVSGHISSLLETIQTGLGVPGGFAGWGSHLMRFWST